MGTFRCGWFAAALLFAYVAAMVFRTVALLFLSGAGCVSTSTVELRVGTPDASRGRLEDAADAFYVARTIEELESAVESARAVAPSSAVYHELSAYLSFLRADHEGRFEHLVSALRDQNNDAAALHLEMLNDISWTAREQSRLVALLESLAVGHADLALRARAAEKLSQLLFERGEMESARRALGLVQTHIPLAVIGTWDNDQGKGFDVPLPPEKEIDLDASYDGSLLPIGWRRNPPLVPLTHQVDLSAIMHPASWSIAYAVGSVRAETAGNYELRLQLGMPAKIWVNGVLLYQERRIDRLVFDQIVIPVRLRAGINRVLIKCAQETGTGRISARLTGPNGEAAKGVTSALPQESPVEGESPGDIWNTHAVVESLVAPLPSASARRSIHAMLWGRALGFDNFAVAHGDDILQTYDGSLVARWELAGALWNHGERGRAADLLEALNVQVGGDLLYVRLQQARFLQQESLLRDARDLLTQTRDEHSDAAEVWSRLAVLFQAEGWVEDECNAWVKANELRHDWLENQMALAGCWRNMGYVDRAIEIYDGILDGLPNQLAVLASRQRLARDNNDLELARDLAERLTRVRSDAPWTWLRLAEVERQLDQPEAERETLGRARECSPDAPKAFQELGEVAYQGGDVEGAIDWWQQALVRDPSDEKLANRLSYLAPTSKDPWEQEMPGQQEIDEAVLAASTTRALSGADVVDLMDHEVTRINSDGSTVSFVTQVMVGVNESGRDKLTRVGLRTGGRLRVFHAYAVDAQGRRVQVSSVRDRTARFRGLKVGSAIVLQYRHDEPPVGYLARHVARGWWFQGVARQARLSRWVVWAPRGTRFHEWLSGEVERTENEQGDDVRLSWTARDVPPVIAEPLMPTVHETSLNLMLSTVPDWETFLEWEKALLHEAFRDSSEVEATAKEIFAGLKDPLAKIERLHEFLMKEIRYQQDYENPIAGVRPHAATVVLKRAYGDCKDKAVLFVTLARLVGVEAHFALVRTRSEGPLREEVPMQQFNHAIVFVPKQPGIPTGRFFDPTADALDLGTLPLSDVGAHSLVFDPLSGDHQWRDIPFQAAENNRRETRSHFQLFADGSAEGTQAMATVGYEASAQRQLARNEQKFNQVLQMWVSQAYPGATASEQKAIEVEDLRKPAEVSVLVRSPAHGRVEGGLLKVRLPPVWSPENVFGLAERKHALVLGAPMEFSWQSRLDIPSGSSVTQLPSSGKVDAGCFAYVRTASRQKQQVVVEQKLVVRCERISVGDYATHRTKAEEMIRMQKEELVIRLSATASLR